MVKEENYIYSKANKFIIEFLKVNNEDTVLLEKWKEKKNNNKFKNILRKKPCKPIRPMSAFIFWCRDERPKIRKELGWKPPYTLEHGLKETAKWYTKSLRANKLLRF